LGDAGRGALGRRPILVDGDDLGATCRKANCRGPSDAVAGASDECNFALELHASLSTLYSAVAAKIACGERAASPCQSEPCPGRRRLGRSGSHCLAAIRHPHRLPTLMSDPNAVAAINRWLAEFEDHLASGDATGAVALFAQRCFWRDMVAFTWNIRTIEGKQEIAQLLAATLARVRPRNFQIEGEARQTEAGLEARLSFETSHCWGRG